MGYLLSLINPYVGLGIAIAFLVFLAYVYYVDFYKGGTLVPMGACGLMVFKFRKDTCVPIYCNGTCAGTIAINRHTGIFPELEDHQSAGAHGHQRSTFIKVDVIDVRQKNKE